MRKARVQSLGLEDPLDKALATPDTPSDSRGSICWRLVVCRGLVPDWENNMKEGHSWYSFVLWIRALEEPSQSDALVTRGKFLLSSWNVPESSPAKGRRTVGLGFGSCSGSARFWPRVCAPEPVGRGAHRKIVELRDLHPPKEQWFGRWRVRVFSPAQWAEPMAFPGGHRAIGDPPPSPFSPGDPYLCPTFVQPGWESLGYAAQFPIKVIHSFQEDNLFGLNC